MKHQYSSSKELNRSSFFVKVMAVGIGIILLVMFALLYDLYTIRKQPSRPFIDYPEEWQAAKVGDTLDVVKGSNDSLFIQLKFKHR